MNRFSGDDSHSDLAEKTMDQMRDLRARLARQNPTLLRDMNRMIWGVSGASAMSAQAHSEEIDPQKNIETVEKLMGMLPMRDDFRSKLEKILSDL